MSFRFFVLPCLFLFLTVTLSAQDQPLDTTVYDGLIDQSFIVLNEGDLEEALRLTDKAIALSERLDGKTDKNSLNGHMNRGNVLRTMGRVKEALDEQLPAVATWALHYDSTSVIFGKMNLYLGTTYFRASKYPEAINAFKKAMELIPKSDDLYWSAFSEIQTVYGNLGRYQEVLKNYPILITEIEKELQALKDAPESPEKENDIKGTSSYLGATIANQAIIYSNTGNIKDAVPTFERGLALIEEARGKSSNVYLDYAPVLVVYYRAIGQAERALAFGNEIWDIAVEAKANPGLMAYIAEVISSVYNQQSQFPKALEFALRSDSLYVAGEKSTSFERSSILLNIGKICNETNKFEQGLEALAKSAEIITALSGKQHRIYQLGLIQIAEIKGKQGDFQGQITMLEDAKAGLAVHSKNSVVYYPVLLSAKALAHEQLGEIEKAAKEYAELYDLFEDQMTKQFDFFGEAEQIAWQKRLVKYQYEAQNFALRHTDTPAMTGTAFDLHTLFQGLAFGNRKRLLERVRNTPNETLQQLYTEWVATRKLISNQYRKSSTNQSPLLDSVEQRGLVLEQQLARQSQSFKEARKTVSWREISKNLPADEAVIEFAFFDSFKEGDQVLGWTIAAFVLRGDQQAPVMIDLFSNEDLIGITSTKKLYGIQPAPGKSNLRQLVYEPLSSHLKGIKRIHYSPAGFLHRVNFGAIPVNDTEVISDHFALHQISHAGELLTRQEQAMTDQQPTAVLFGGIDYELGLTTDLAAVDEQTPAMELSRSPAPDSTAFRAYKDGNWDQLSWTANEVTDVEQVLRSKTYATTLLTGAAATEEAFKQLAKSGAAPRVLHLATHGYFFPKVDAAKKKDAAKTGFEAARQPLVRSGLILAGANRAWRGEPIPAGQEDGILTAYEIAEMDLSNTELVVLSACETGLGDIDGSEGVFGLQRAFKMAGAKYVLMSLWNVKDQKTYEFMTMFYELWQGGKSIPEAYQESQSKMRTKYALPFAPRNWAGFVLLH